MLYAIACSNQAYELTSPASLSFHVLLRKTYSIGAFALLGFLLGRSRLRRLGTVASIAFAIALYSAAIEVGQYFAGSREGLVSNGLDVLMGFVGGGLGAALARAFPEKRATPAKASEPAAPERRPAGP